jgi:salicylate hydroxylase
LVFADGTEATGDVVVGADGVHSTIRRAVFGTDDPQFTGCVAWRGLVPGNRLPAHLMEPIGTNWIGPGRHIVHYPVRNGDLFNFVAVVERDDWTLESWTERGSRDECAADFVGWHEDIQTIIRELDQPYKWALIGREPMQRWSDGRVTLLGDACHPMLPFLAQGAGMAIEDGFVLARCLEAYASDPAKALLHYEAARVERTSRVVRGSAENGRRFHSNALSTTAEAQAYVDREWESNNIDERYDWLYRYDATTVPIDAARIDAAA